MKKILIGLFLVVNFCYGFAPAGTTPVNVNDGLSLLIDCESYAKLLGIRNKSDICMKHLREMSKVWIEKRELNYVLEVEVKDLVENDFANTATIAERNMIKEVIESTLLSSFSNLKKVKEVEKEGDISISVRMDVFGSRVYYGEIWVDFGATYPLNPNRSYRTSFGLERKEFKIFRYFVKSIIESIATDIFRIANRELWYE